jgi:hypothetical protein
LVMHIVLFVLFVAHVSWRRTSSGRASTRRCL